MKDRSQNTTRQLEKEISPRGVHDSKQNKQGGMNFADVKDILDDLLTSDNSTCARHGAHSKEG